MGLQLHQILVSTKNRTDPTPKCCKLSVGSVPPHNALDMRMSTWKCRILATWIATPPDPTSFQQKPDSTEKSPKSPLHPLDPCDGLDMRMSTWKCRILATWIATPPDPTSFQQNRTQQKNPQNLRCIGSIPATASTSGGQHGNVEFWHHGIESLSDLTSFQPKNRTQHKNPHSLRCIRSIPPKAST